ncbi:MAG: energy-coupling factor transporter transmembrane component T family protein, partial [Anaerolineales bacterium]
TFAFDPFIPALLGAGLWGITLLLGRVSLSRLLRWSIPLVLLPLPLVAFTALYADVDPAAAGPVLFRFGPWLVTRGAAVLGLGIGLRLTAILAGSLLYIATTDPSDFAVSLIQNLRLPYRFAYALLISYRFLPEMRREAETLRLAHRVRGRGRPRTLRDRLDGARLLAIPLLASAIRKSERTALAMDARAFGASQERTYLRRMQVRAGDVGFVVLGAAYTAAVYALAIRLGLADLAWIPGA